MTARRGGGQHLGRTPMGDVLDLNEHGTITLEEYRRTRGQAPAPPDLEHDEHQGDEAPGDDRSAHRRPVGSTTPPPPQTTTTSRGGNADAT